MKKYLVRTLAITSLASALLVGNFAFADNTTSNSKTKNVKKTLVFKSLKNLKNFSFEEKEVLEIAKTEIGSEPHAENKISIASYNLDHLNKNEVLVCYESALYCGHRGSCVTLYKYNETEWKPIQYFTTICEISVLKTKTNGFYDLSINQESKIGQENFDWNWQPFLFKWNEAEYKKQN
jgi:hypothetical protein